MSEQQILTEEGLADTEIEFLRESNAIESEFTDAALEDAKAAWLYAKQHRHTLDLNVILKIHFLVMRRLNTKIAGKWRNCAVTIGGRYCPQESKYFLRKRVQTWLDNCTPTGLGAEEDIKRWHVAFEEIHPFTDGNGRTGRIIMNMQRLKVSLPILIIHVGEEQQAYYRWFLKEWDTFACKKCGAVTKQAFCDACYGSMCRACGRKSYGQDYCNWCWKGRKR